MSKKFALLLISALAAATLLAQNPKKGRESELRTLHGTVVDKQDTPVDTAVVYLKNERTQDVKTYISDSEGHFRFSGLDPNVDYQVHAEHEGWTSSSRSISSFDPRKDVDATLKLDHKKSEK